MTPEEIRHHYTYLALSLRALEKEFTPEEFDIIHVAVLSFARRKQIFAPDGENWPEGLDQKWNALK